MFVATQRTEGVSTSDVIARIVRGKKNNLKIKHYQFMKDYLFVRHQKPYASIFFLSDYDIYIQRNYARGYTRKDLNVSFLRDQRIKIENFGDKVKDKIGKGEKLLFSFLKSFGGEHDWIFRPIKNVGKRAIRALSPPGSPKGKSIKNCWKLN